MGEAKRRRQREVNSSCFCQSGLRANDCCWKLGKWFKSPTLLELKNLPKGDMIDRCYLRSLGSCGGKISSEHYISQSVLKFLSENSDLKIEGLPWLRGETKTVGINSLTAKCLCEVHNSKLGLLDESAIAYFKALYSVIENEGDQSNFLLSGHDIERWLLKTMMAMAASKNFSDGASTWSGNFISGLNLIDMLDDPSAWPEGVGLYFIAEVGDLKKMKRKFDIGPFFNDNNELAGIQVSLNGLDAVLSLQGRSLFRREFKGANFRMENFNVKHMTGNSCLKLSWLTR